MSYRIYIVEDHPVVRQTYVQFIERDSELTVCGEAADGMEALQVIPELNPDIVLLDISLPGMNGIEVLRRLKQKLPNQSVLVVSGHEGELYAARALEAGAEGFLDKMELARELTDAIHTVIAGKTFVSKTPHI